LINPYSYIVLYTFEEVDLVVIAVTPTNREPLY
jgi:hypothetical protein